VIAAQGESKADKGPRGQGDKPLGSLGLLRRGSLNSGPDPTGISVVKSPRKKGRGFPRRVTSGKPRPVERPAGYADLRRRTTKKLATDPISAMLLGSGTAMATGFDTTYPSAPEM
jgi:hypothetical protein